MASYLENILILNSYNSRIVLCNLFQQMLNNYLNLGGDLYIHIASSVAGQYIVNRNIVNRASGNW